MRCLQRLGEAMKMDRISIDLGMDMTIDALIARAEQLVKLERDALADRSTHIYNLQRKVKSLKEQLESKDLHIDLLRKNLDNLLNNNRLSFSELCFFTFRRIANFLF